MTPSTTNTAAREVIETCRAALAEELAGWDIEPPIAHVKTAHDACVNWLTLTQQQGGEQEATCAGCNGRGEVGGWAGDGYQTDPCPFCTPSGLPDALTGDFDCPKAAECRACPCGFCTALRSKQPAASEGDGQGIDDRALDAALMAARNATWDIGEDASHSSAEKIALAVLAALRTPASEGDGGRVVVTDEMVERAADAYEAAAESEGFGRVDGSERVTHLRFIRAAIDAALLAKSAAYEALVAGCSELAAKLDRQAAENYTDRGNALSRCADDIRLLVSDDRPSHTAGENDA